jgi:hypothetical protein
MGGYIQVERNTYRGVKSLATSSSCLQPHYFLYVTRILGCHKLTIIQYNSFLILNGGDIFLLNNIFFK